MREQDSEPKVQKWREDFCTRYPETNNEGGDEETPGKYCVGLVMQHRRYNYRCAIFGWDTHCVAERVRRTKWNTSFAEIFDAQLINFPNVYNEEQ